MTHSIFGAAIAMLVAICPSLSSAATVFSVESTFLASVGPVESEGFNDLPGSTAGYDDLISLGSQQDFGDFTVSSEVRNALAYSEVPSLVSEGSGALALIENDTLTLTFDEAINYVGFRINEFNGTSMEYVLNTPGTFSGTFFATGDFAKDFVGISSDVAFTTLTLNFSSAFASAVVGFDDLVYGSTATAIPLPAGLPLLVGAFGVLAVVRRRKAARSA